ncbi:ABC transporter ATP-binding protein [Aphanothece sacrum]|uniref:ABC transporter related n=1 Tax=Aphanothece sacrum FPU1 TaxID=1920663 RepID=A0A401IEN7_APHSA|nr:ABC transporter ATP-binding protein [Aphanothece sacrum]GBF79735.1 ABC transporter related [Aphanothece sacrum FPU1]GBF85733.1 ABC transporter family protein [Aphanothece sacrum FPU3]
MSDEVLIKVENVSKKFCRDLKRSLWYGVQDITSEVTGSKYERELRKDEFWSVNNISFELRRGECLGLIGPNGAGKSTLLKILNGLIKPDKGRIEIRGRIGSLIELSAGFNPILTGRENIYSRGAILGFSTKEIDKKLDAIIDFSELEEFIDSPVVNYSSGMQVRLGFAVASQMEPDVLLLDEVLAVGDVGFRAKCFNSIQKMIQNAAVVLVSHSMPQISRVSSDIIVMNHGVCEFQGNDVAKGIDQFYSYFSGEEAMVAGSGKAVIHEVELATKSEKNIESINYLDELTINISCTVNANISKFCVVVKIISQELDDIAYCNSFFNGINFTNTGEKMQVSLNIGTVNLTPGCYKLTLIIAEENNAEELCLYSNIKPFRVVGKFYCGARIQLWADWNIETLNKANNQ